MNQSIPKTAVGVTNNTKIVPSVNTLLQRYQIVTSQNQTKDPSPGSSPTEGLANFTRNGPIVNEQSNSIDRSTIESPTAAAASLTPDDSIVCPLCNEKFLQTPNNHSVLIQDHLEICLAASEPTKKPSDYICPTCERKFPADDETTYHQHLSDCINRDDFH